jgi:hypothetical protein
VQHLAALNNTACALCCICMRAKSLIAARYTSGNEPSADALSTGYCPIAASQLLAAALDAQSTCHTCHTVYMSVCPLPCTPTPMPPPPAGLDATHQVVGLARENGFTNVHDYLVHLVTGRHACVLTQ